MIVVVVKYFVSIAVRLVKASILGHRKVICMMSDMHHNNKILIMIIVVVVLDMDRSIVLVNPLSTIWMD